MFKKYIECDIMLGVKKHPLKDISYRRNLYDKNSGF